MKRKKIKEKKMKSTEKTNNHFIKWNIINKDSVKINDIAIIIADRIQPVFSDLDPAHVTFYIVNKHTLS